MPLFVDPKARVRLTFPDDCDVPELRGEWIDVRESIGSAAWRELQAGAATIVPNPTGETDWQAAFSGVNGLRRLALWIEAVSFVNANDQPYPAQNMADRMRWLGELWPPAGTEIDLILTAHIQRVWAEAVPVLHPKAEPSSDLETTVEPPSPMGE